MHIIVIIPVLLIVIAIAIWAYKGLLIISQSEVVIVEWLGNYRKTLTGGPHIIWPFIEKPRTIKWKVEIRDSKTDEKRFIKKDTYRIDLREVLYDFPSQHVITKDNVPIEIDAILFFQVIDAYRVVYQVADLPDSIEKITEVTLRDVIGGMELDETLKSREEINARMRTMLDQASNRWGVQVTRVELQDIIPPQDVQDSMKKQMAAERERRAMIIEAEGERTSAIAKAEGGKQATILRADGEAEARYKVAQAEAESIKKLIEVIGSGKYSSTYMATLKYIDAFKEIINKGDNKVVFMPYEASAILGSLGMIRELLTESKGIKSQDTTSSP